MIKNQFCRPRMASAAEKTTWLSPMSLLDRIKEAVFRFIMISVLSKGHADVHRSVSQPSDYGYYSNDAHQLEAVADCIEFIRKSANGGGKDDCDSAASCYADSKPSAGCLRSGESDV